MADGGHLYHYPIPSFCDRMERSLVNNAAASSSLDFHSALRWLALKQSSYIAGTVLRLRRVKGIDIDSGFKGTLLK